MSMLGEVAPGSFDSYEGIRIVIPGLIAFTVGLATFKTLAPTQDLGLIDDPLVGLVGALIVGLFLYFWDFPARAASYGENQPTDYLESRFPHVNPSELLTAYLLALNTKMPSNTRNRSLYMGSMYRIGMEMILALAIASTLTFGASVFAYGQPAGYESRWPRLAAALVLLASYTLGVSVNQSYERRTAERSREAVTRLGRSIWNDVADKSSCIYAFGAIVLMLPNLTILIEHASPILNRSVAVAGMGICFGVWTYRYVRGFQQDPEKPRRRRRMHSATAGAWFVAPIVISLVTYEPGSTDVLGAVNRLAGWTGVAALVVLSVAIRGHERKLHGVYRGQTRWLSENPDAMDGVLPSRPDRS